MAGKDDQVQRAKLAEQAERYDDMATAMKKVKPPRLSSLSLLSWFLRIGDFTLA